ncbi:FAD-dependent oxidoreductase [Amycolatopsis acidicola]|uniref:FAD-dependent oxidoreductase n=1 Tax=Amycolatopsis acidicola TaxID=2596893 RepID=A0A5N0UY42_9PSEU|nr:FAD-dependent monooxygenase [Amycolatopsis acidicola]KAA9158571.1 FAD-dependent oxidoreductase [Amycolatopsis acidicola]
MTEDVVIAGAGPNGLFLACELRLAGVKPVVLERLPEPPSTPKANGLVGRVVQLLDYRGLYQRISGAGKPSPAPGYQFAGFPLELRSLGDHPLYVLPLPQRTLEARLTEYALELGVEIRRGQELVSLSQDEDKVVVETNDGTLETRYLVGADGGHSVVRKQVGIGFPGTSDDSFTSVQGRVLLDPSAFTTGGEIETPDGPVRPFQWHRSPRGAFALAPFEPGVFRVSLLEWGRPAVSEDIPVTLDELRAAVRRVLGRDLPMSLPEDDDPLVWRRRTGSNARQAERYREGRVLLLGDAAHVHPAVGGPGLNLGLQDAVNLGWKLAAEVRGWAPPGLLDTYESERLPLGRRVLLHTQAQMTLLSPGEEVGSVRALFGELLDESVVRQRIAEMLAGADVRYDLTAPAHPLLGRWMPDVPLRADGVTRVAELMRSGRAVLLDFTGAHDGFEHEQVDYVRAETAEPPADAVLIRPDGYVAWAGGDGLTEALGQWFRMSEKV